jgi:GxxExxY protein
MRTTNDITAEIIDAAYGIHTGIGPGLLESVYETLLEKELTRRGLTVERQKPVSFEYDGVRFEDGFRVDLLVENQVVVELKCVERIAPVHPKQVLTYLRLMKRSVGLLINFGSPTLKEGVKRIVNGLAPEPSAVLSVSSAPLRANAVSTGSSSVGAG